MHISEHVQAELMRLHRSVSKHGNYQPLPGPLVDVLPPSGLEDPLWRSPRPQLELILHTRDRWQDQPFIVELGANTGYLTLSLASLLPEKPFVAIEANPDHARFIELAADVLDCRNIRVIPKAMTPYDVGLNFPQAALFDFNVAHHLGVDLKVAAVSGVASWWKQLSGWLSPPGLGPHYLQVGYSWGGDRQSLLHSPSDVSGFADEIRRRLPPGRFCSTHAIASQEGSALGFSYKEMESSRLTSSVDRTYLEHGLRGEYWRRPVFIVD